MDSGVPGEKEALNVVCVFPPSREKKKTLKDQVAVASPAGSDSDADLVAKAAAELCLSEAEDRLSKHRCVYLPPLFTCPPCLPAPLVYLPPLFTVLPVFQGAAPERRGRPEAAAPAGEQEEGVSEGCGGQGAQAEGAAAGL